MNEYTAYNSGEYSEYSDYNVGYDPGYNSGYNSGYNAETIQPTIEFESPIVVVNEEGKVEKVIKSANETGGTPLNISMVSLYYITFVTIYISAILACNIKFKNKFFQYLFNKNVVKCDDTRGFWPTGSGKTFTGKKDINGNDIYEGSYLYSLTMSYAFYFCNFTMCFPLVTITTILIIASFIELNCGTLREGDSRYFGLVFPIIFLFGFMGLKVIGPLPNVIGLHAVFMVILLLFVCLFSWELYRIFKKEFKDKLDSENHLQNLIVSLTVVTLIMVFLASGKFVLGPKIISNIGSALSKVFVYDKKLNTDDYKLIFAAWRDNSIALCEAAFIIIFGVILYLFSTFPKLPLNTTCPIRITQDPNTV